VGVNGFSSLKQICETAYTLWSASNLSFACRHLVPAKIFAFNDLANYDGYNG